MNLWVNDTISAPHGYFWCKSVNDVLYIIDNYENNIDFLNQDLLDFVQECENEWGCNYNIFEDYVEIKCIKINKKRNR